MTKKEKAMAIAFLALSIIDILRNCYTIGYALEELIDTPTKD